MSEKKCYEDEYSVFKIDDGESHWVIELTLNDAIRTHAIDSMDYPSIDAYMAEHGPIACETVPWDREIHVTDDQGKKETKLARDWAITNRGLLCSTCY